jgi:hypothetical protein
MPVGMVKTEYTEQSIHNTHYGSIIIKCAIEEITQTSKKLALKTKVLYQLRRK